MKSRRPDGVEKIWKGDEARFYIFSQDKENISGDEADRLLKTMMGML